MTGSMLLVPIFLPLAVAVLVVIAPSRVKYLREVISVAGSIAILYLGWALFQVKNLAWKVNWFGPDVNFDLRLYHFSAFVLLGLAGFLFLIVLFSTVKMQGEPPRSRILCLRLPDGHVRQRCGPGQ